ncbi:hypothetical protein GS16_01755 [Candidatus Liberibacter solanacearum]|uniref:hypothetical protein n=1 Tax=Candidatus Liberibacter solanacearum TaxID=556287 RepID=UPI0004FF6475|nr:hypothetical protein [Candidatus Liberibacter solanacearum]KGB27772.1 hypothetical protein GS16_01755 [Candidatus Liberibacter solanacearum]
MNIQRLSSSSIIAIVATTVMLNGCNSNDQKANEVLKLAQEAKESAELILKNLPIKSDPGPMGPQGKQGDKGDKGFS